MNEIKRRDIKTKRLFISSFMKLCRDQLDRGLLRKMARKPTSKPWDQMMDKKNKSVIMELTCKKLQTKRIEQTPDWNHVMALDKCPEGKRVEKILTTVRHCGQLCHLVKWRDHNKCDLVVSQALNKKFPQEVITYYEDHLFLVNSTQFHCTDSERSKPCFISSKHLFVRKRVSDEEEEVMSRKKLRLVSCLNRLSLNRK